MNEKQAKRCRRYARRRFPVALVECSYLRPRGKVLERVAEHVDANGRARASYVADAKRAWPHLSARERGLLSARWLS